MKKKKFRHEIKHFISNTDYYSIRNRLKQITTHDKFSNEFGEYQIRSLYFDNYNDKALFEKISGINEREKFRIRFYNFDSSFMRLEKKSKVNGYTLKESTPITYQQCQRILEGNYDCLLDNKTPLMFEFHQKLLHEQLRPETIVDYIREAYVFSPGNVRVTFDKNIRTGLFAVNLLDKKLPTIPAMIGDNPIVMEVKFDEFIPEIISHLIQTGNQKAIAVSKYVLCRNYY